MICSASASSGARISNPFISGHVVDHESEVTGTADEHQDMPDLVVAEPGEGVRPATAVDARPNGVGSPAGNEPEQPVQGDGVRQWYDGYQGQISHGQVGSRGNPYWRVEEIQLEGNPCHGNQPHDGE